VAACERQRRNRSALTENWKNGSQRGKTQQGKKKKKGGDSGRQKKRRSSKIKKPIKDVFTFEHSPKGKINRPKGAATGQGKFYFFGRAEAGKGGEKGRERDGWLKSKPSGGVPGIVGKKFSGPT